jgi:hypothetical protein
VELPRQLGRPLGFPRLHKQLREVNRDEHQLMSEIPRPELVPELLEGALGFF